MTFAAQLAAHQKRLGFSQPQLAAFLEISPRLVWSWLNGQPPSLQIAAEGALARLEKAPAPPPANP
jgi:transcriptional regulator with XRE-family HTH domain